MTGPLDSLTLTDLAAARALRQHTGFLSLFTDPRSPTQAARAAMHAGEEDVVTFGTPERPALLAPTPPAQQSDEPYPTHADLLTLRLSPERYRRLAADLSRLLTEAAEGAARGVREQGQDCTLAVLAFAEPGDTEVRGILRNTDSFLDVSE